MPLEKQVVEFVFREGVDTKEDPRVSMKPSRLEHSIFSTGDLNKHPGRKSLPSTIAAGGTLNSGESVFALGDALARINGGSTYALAMAAGANKWPQLPGGQNYCTFSRQTMPRAVVNQTTPDFASVNGIGVLAWSLANVAISVCVFDLATGAIYQSGAVSITGGAQVTPRCVALGSTIAILARNTGTGLYGTSIDTNNPSVATAPFVLLKNDAYAASFTFDAFTYGSYGVCVYAQGAGGTDLALFAFDATGILAAPAGVTIAGVTGAGGLALMIQAQRDAAGNIYVVFGDNAAARTRFTVRNAAFGAVVAPTDIVTTGNWSGTVAGAVAGAMIETATGQMTVIMTSLRTTTAAVAYLAYLGKVVLGPAGIVTAFAELPSTQGMFITNDFVPYDGTFIFGAINLEGSAAAISGLLGSAQTCAWVLDPSAKVVARGLQGVATAGTVYTRVNRSFVQGATVNMFWVDQYRTSFVQGGTAPGGPVVAVSKTGISRTQIVRTKTNALPIVQVGTSTYVGGGLPRLIDGTQVTEDGFATPPTVMSTTPGGAASGNTSAGVYLYAFLWSWIGTNGELVRGPITQVTATLVNTGSCAFTLLTMPESMRDQNYSGGSGPPLVTLEIYRTTANGTVLYKVGTANNDLTTTTLTFNDGVSDAAAQVGEFIYTTGGILEWEAPPPYAAACSHQGRLLIVPSENPFQFWPSSQWKPGENVRFSSFTPVNIPSDTGPLLGIASMDGKIALLTQSAAFITLGDGPDQLGNNPYPSPQRVVGVDTGPLPGSPVVVTPLGIIYQSTKGLTLLDRALNQAFIGADVEAFTVAPWILRSITVHPTLQQIHFQVDDGSDIPGTLFPDMTTSNGGYRLVYDYFYKQWTVDPAWGAQGAVIYQSNYVQVRSDGACFRETPGLFTDNGAAYGTVLETPWIKLAGTSGYQRIYYIEILGSVYSDFTLKLEVAYSYDTTDPQVPVYNSADTVTLDTAAARAAGASGFELGGAFSMRHHLGTKCSSVKFRISDVNIQGNGQGMGLTSISLQYGIKQGVLPLSAAQTA